MGKTAVFVSRIPLPLTSISLGRLITVLKNPPQNFFDPHEKLAAKPRPDSDHSDVLNPSEFIERSYGTKLELVLASFASAFFKVESTHARRLAACRMTRYFILNADDWFDSVCGEKETQLWLERQTMRKKDIYLVTEYCTLVQHTSSTDTTLAASAGESVTAPLAAAAGISLPTPWDPSAAARVESSHTSRVSYEIPGEKVFWVGYQQVKLSKNKEGQLQYSLSDKRRWQELSSRRDDSVDKRVVVIADLCNVSIPDDCETLETEHTVYLFERTVEQ
ncbi:hypothetical protein LMH87_001405 [Akanthomyces muscarius]|uniref:Uncharacterized protein n=1 Tax=Akanthomyces muscarius TaxID=2231603 RepID=A0A9W8Q6N6_AKAMU|nr:hypothetical protein LMH87_001405 [Akanthomyces muscarius]KAJ4146846.1 hypothetical protein LMH87_001405 [Akanthomyces muscarius]